ncbi:MAG: hypothetical protein KBD36_02845 [Alphaproteobacteria bacterium]|nr:hypothetical protein [Alphaproteobacteria bacterium]MBP9776763.1 hypothetical protein [Alphaproteobacteria bacterium]
MLQISTKTKKNSGASVIHLITDYRLLITGTAALCLSGCMGIYEGGFECPPGKGVGCKSISDVNQMVDHGDLPTRSLPDLPQTHCEQCEANRDQQITPEYLETSQIWYSPSINIDQKEKKKVKVLDVPIFI